MTTKHRRVTEELVAEQAKVAEEWFLKRFEDEKTFEQRLRDGLNFGAPDPHIEDKIRLTRGGLGLFSQELFQAMICGGHSFKPAYVAIMWDRLVASGIVTRAFAHMRGNPFADHQIDNLALLSHIRDDTFTNLFVLPARLPEIYAQSIAAIDVLKGKDPARGTGFIVAHKHAKYFVTCKHNVDPDEGVVVQSIESNQGAKLTLGPMIHSDQFDISIARLEVEFGGRCFALSEDVEVFDEVFTLGYPYVPRAEPSLVGHRGEVNGRTMLYVEKCPVLLISNLVSPGNSGGPVLLRSGRCVGMTARWLEGQLADLGSEDVVNVDSMRFSAAIPAYLIREVIEQAFGS